MYVCIYVYVISTLSVVHLYTENITPVQWPGGGAA